MKQDRAKMLEHEIKDELESIPKTREGRMASILATIEAHPEGLHLQSFIDVCTFRFNMTRNKIVEYFKELERIRKIRVKTFKVYPRE